MKQKVVSYKTAMALKEKGFNEPTEFCYCGRETSLHMIAPHLTNESLGEGKCSAPTIDEVRQWLKDKHNIYIEIPLDVERKMDGGVVLYVEYYYNFGYVKVGGVNFLSSRRFICWDNALTAAINFIVEKGI